MKYMAGKENARLAAMNWQAEFAVRDISWGELAEAVARFERLGRRYGLMREFRENGVI